MIEFDNPKSLNEVFQKSRMCYEQHKQRSKFPKAWKDKRYNKINQRNKCFQPSLFRNMEKGFQRKDYHSNTPNTQRGIKLVNVGFKKVGDIPIEPLKWWECGETHL